jgi:hypothetical protein
MSSFAKLDAELQKLATINTQELLTHIERLYGIRDWALRHLDVDYREGDRVVITRDLFTGPGTTLSRYAEAARAGAAAAVRYIDFNQFHDYWYAMVVLDVEWETIDPFGGGELMRFWHGPAVDTPDGMERPSEYDQERYPNGRKHSFAVHVQHLRKAGPDE